MKRIIKFTRYTQNKARQISNTIKYIKEEGRKGHLGAPKTPKQFRTSFGIGIQEIKKYIKRKRGK